MTKLILSMCVLHFKMISVFLIPLVVSFGSQCGTMEHKLFPAENRVLKNFTYREKTVPHYVICGRDCNIDGDCKSFNFNTHYKLCELNNSTRVEHPESFLQCQGSVYFDSNEDTPLFALPDVSFDRYRSCKTLLEAGYCTSGVYKIYPEGLNDVLQVYCDMDIDGGGWIVFQRREDGSVDFYRDWSQYKSGFGDLSGEHWLGNDNLVSLTSDTSHGTWDLRIDIEGSNDTKAFAKYTDFQIAGEKYTLKYGEYDVSSTAGDSIWWHNGMNFTTKDNDNDIWSWNCAQRNEGAWWFTNCGSSHLNGNYFPDEQVQGYKHIVWYHWHKDWNNLKKTSMKMRESDM